MLNRFDDSLESLLISGTLEFPTHLGNREHTKLSPPVISCEKLRVRGISIEPSHCNVSKSVKRKKDDTKYNRLSRNNTSDVRATTFVFVRRILSLWEDIYRCEDKSVWRHLSVLLSWYNILSKYTFLGCNIGSDKSKKAPETNRKNQYDYTPRNVREDFYEYVGQSVST